MRQLQINLDEFAFLLHRGKTLDLHCFLNMETGAILSIPSDRKILLTILNLPEDSEMLTTNSLVARLIPNDQDYLTIPDNFQQNVYRLMSDFIHSIRNNYTSLADMLDASVHKEGGYDSFMHIIRKNGSIINHYLRYRDRFFEQSARQWLTKNNLELI